MEMGSKIERIVKSDFGQFILKNIRKIFNVDVGVKFPRHSVRFAKKHFKNKPINAIEIGILWGTNTLSILKTLNIHKIYLIDPYDSYKNYEQFNIKKILPKAEVKARKRLSKYRNKIVWIKDYSHNAVKKITGKVDFVYIDGNHSYRFVKKDIEDYWPKVKSGGILAGHDITHERFNRDIFRALKEFSNKAKQDPYISRTDWWLLKK